MDPDEYFDAWRLDLHVLRTQLGLNRGLLVSTTGMHELPRTDDTRGSYENVPPPGGPLEVRPPAPAPRVGRPDRGSRTRVKAARRARRAQQSRGK